MSGLSEKRITDALVFLSRGFRAEGTKDFDEAARRVERTLGMLIDELRGFRPPADQPAPTETGPNPPDTAREHCPCGDCRVWREQRAERLAKAEPAPWKVGDRVRHDELPMRGTIERIEPDGLGHFVLWDNGARCNYDAHELTRAPQPVAPRSVEQKPQEQ